MACTSRGKDPAVRLQQMLKFNISENTAPQSEDHDMEEDNDGTPLDQHFGDNESRPFDKARNFGINVGHGNLQVILVNHSKTFTGTTWVTELVPSLAIALLDMWFFGCWKDFLTGENQPRHIGDH
jgi:hypothetical protein